MNFISISSVCDAANRAATGQIDINSTAAAVFPAPLLRRSSHTGK
jgi:hypothetical protein